ncbi:MULTISPECIES: YihY/virulence factor BrkB family protein [unclassified Mycobacterium]|uniref:YihY/virulence factor BrkB family protein n=1 Tax=unclassified Mycobacterium TaxID=2642494 RepID=UPI000F99101C|nr:MULTISPECIES: YihY/virulence factor BrkB family protein [unclassified Mycobacterium]MDP7702720.1 YihY/virulence factor BrkB family protein [Mycobacterium sp. TY815]MDP7721212.1 YihY/virulence factor BrkB family protein [Mycobacterium sp. TY814]RUP02176.1 MAG: YihY/virulence factor BrkB family protein [Mycobacterium sp.]
MNDQVPKPSRHHVWQISRRTLSKAWDDSIFSESAEAGFWTCLSTPPLLLGILGALAWVAPLFGADTLPSIIKSTLSTARNFFSPNVVNEIIEPSIRDITETAGGEVVSLGFLISLWAGSSAISSFVDAVVEAHDQTPLRHPVRQRFFALFLYIMMLAFVVITAPVAVVGPRKVSEHIPLGLQNLLHYGYYPALILGLMAGVTVLYRVALPVPLPTHRLIPGTVLASVVFLVATLGLRFYLRWIGSTGYTYGALATPIAFLLFAFFGGFSIMIGAELNAAIQEEWPAPATHAHRLRNWLVRRTAALTGSTDPAPPQSNIPAMQAPDPVEPKS